MENQLLLRHSGFNCSFVLRHSDFVIPLAIPGSASNNRCEMSGIFFDLPSLRFLRRFRFFETTMRTFASSLLRWLSTPAYGSRRVHFRLNEAEFPAASQSACKLSEWTLGDSRAADGASIDALRPFNNWVNLKDQHELLFIRETAAPFARRIPTQRQWPFPRSSRGSEGPKENILAAGGCIFWRWQGRKEASNGGAQWCAAFAITTET